MTKTRVIIIAAGDAVRWNNHLGIPKHFAPVDGEPIIYRTTRQLKEYPDLEVFVVGTDERYDIDGSTLYIPNKNSNNRGLDKFLSSKELWLGVGRTIILYGDVYFTDEAMKHIIAEPTQGFTLFARPFNSVLTGSGGECFALSFYNADSKLDYAIERCSDLLSRGIIDRDGGWEVYRAYIDIPDELMNKHLVSNQNFFAINDWTDDFDFPEDYDVFVQKRKEAGL